jgi:hypothetical protein
MLAGAVSSMNGDTRAAAYEAARASLARLAGAAPTYGFVFVSPRHDLAAALATVQSECGDAPVIGCTTAGEIVEQGLQRGSVTVLLVAAEATAHAAFATGLKANPERVARSLLEAAGSEKKVAASRDHRHLTTVLLTDGLAGTGEQLVNAIYGMRPQAGARIVGGAAGDDGGFKATLVGAKGSASSDAAAALHVFGRAPWGVGINHGLRPTTKPMRVTRAHDNVVQEIDGQPAFLAYKRHAASRGIDLLPESAGSYLVANELGLHFFDKIQRARAPLAVEADGSLRCAANIPKGAMVSILDGDPASMIDAARSAAEAARAELHGAPVGAVLLFDCVCRGMILKEHFGGEVTAVRSIFPGVPLAGFLTYGEIARHHETLDGWHNTTAVVVAIPA